MVALASSAEMGITTAEAAARLSRDGPNDVPKEPSHPVIQFARKFWGLSAWMIELIVVLSLILHKYADLWVALSLLVVNAVLSFAQEQRASAVVTALRRKLQVTARVLRDGTWQSVPARVLVRGDVVRLRSGDFVPADVLLIDGTLKIDQSALTGESQEQERTRDGSLFSGSTIHQGEATAIVVGTGTRTYYGRTTQLVQSARPKLHAEEVVSRVVRWLFLIVGALVTVALVVAMAEGLPLLDILPLGLVLLMSAVPVALPVMFTVSMAVGSKELARRGVLVTRLSAAEDAANMDVLCADKTGTLTINQLSLVSVLPQPGFKDDDVVHFGALASNEADQDPIDLAFLRRAHELKLLAGTEKTTSFQPFSAQSRRTEAVVESGGHAVHVMKGALRTVAQLSSLDARVLEALEKQVAEQAQSGCRALAVGKSEANMPMGLVGIAFLRDPPRPDSKSLIQELRALGVAVKMLTGDALPVGREIAHELGLGEIVRAPELRNTQLAGSTDSAQFIERCDGFAEVFPEDKFTVVKSLQAAGHVVGMTGDGVNDAPALRQAEVGIAVSSATDVAKGAASVVLTTEGLKGIVNLVRNGREIYQRVLTWIVNKVSRTIFKAGFVVVAFLVTGQFVISALGMVLLVFMTDFVKITLATDNVRPSQMPETWNIGPLVRVAGVMGVLMLIETLGLLAFAWHRFDLAHNTGQLQTFTFQTLLFFAIFSIVSVRERHAFWSSWPSKILAIALIADTGVGVIIGQLGLSELRPLPIARTALAFGYAFVFSLCINDMVKTFLIGRFSPRSIPRSINPTTLMQGASANSRDSAAASRKPK